MRKRNRHLLAALLLIGVIASAFGGRGILSLLRASARDIPTTRVQKTNLEVDVYANGDLRPMRSLILLAPPVWGSLQIVKLLRTGTAVKSGEVVLQFDSSEQQYKLEQAQFDLAAADQEIIKAKADTEVQKSQDQVALLRARFDVRRAELDVSRNELLSPIDAQKNNLALEEARRRLAQLEQDVKSRQEVNTALMAVTQEKRSKAMLAIMQAQDAMERMTIKAELDGIVSVRENPNAMGGIMIGGIPFPEFKEGDVAPPGTTVAEVYDPTALEIQAKIAENDRANISPGQAVNVTVDAVPDELYSGKVKGVASMTSRGMFWDTASMRKFDATFVLDETDEKLHPGQSVQVTIKGTTLSNVLVLPRQAIFVHDGNPVVYVRSGSKFEAREVKIASRTESRAAIEGIAEGTEVALVDPQAQAGKKSIAGQAVPAIGGDTK